VQGAGAVSAAVTALLADLTRAEVRTRAMAVVGVSIGLSFVVALVLGPVLGGAIGVPGIFLVMLAMALSGIALLVFAVPAEPERTGGAESRPLSALLELLLRPGLRPLYAGVFALHFIMTATFLSVPQALATDLGLAPAGHWKVYLGVFVASLAGTIPLILATERSTRGRALFIGAVLLAGGAQALLGFDHGHLWWVLGAMTLFFATFNYLEARLPALLTVAAPGTERGAALGIFATAQFLAPSWAGRSVACCSVGSGCTGSSGAARPSRSPGRALQHSAAAPSNIDADAPDSQFPPGRSGTVKFHSFTRG